MWKDFFYYTKSQRRAVIALLMLIALLLVGIWVLPEVSSPSLVKDSSKDSVALKEFEKDMQDRRYSQKKQTGSMVSEVQPELFPFDPNVADSIELSSLGLSSYVVRNIMKYRLKGGRFRTPEAFARIYGLTEEQFKVLKPYIRIVQVDKPKPKKADTMIAAVVPERKVFKYPEGTLVDVNVADTAELKKIPGIGSGIAKAIVAYRNRLGGFYSLSQLEEISYVKPELLKWFKLEGGTIRKLNINRMGLDKLRSHPYLNFYQAKVIVEHRRKRGEIKSLSQLSLYEEFTEKDLIRLSAYVSFD
jgi:competence ComEA-like helix-hairpin-helix protein